MKLWTFSPIEPPPISLYFYRTPNEQSANTDSSTCFDEKWQSIQVKTFTWQRKLRPQGIPRHERLIEDTGKKAQRYLLVLLPAELPWLEGPAQGSFTSPPNSNMLFCSKCLDRFTIETPQTNIVMQEFDSRVEEPILACLKMDC